MTAVVIGTRQKKMGGVGVGGGELINCNLEPIYDDKKTTELGPFLIPTSSGTSCHSEKHCQGGLYFAYYCGSRMS